MTRHRQSEVEQFPGTEHVSHRFPYSDTVVLCLGEQTIDDFREEAIWPVGMNTIGRGIEFFHSSPYPVAILHYGHLITRDSLVGNVDDMFNVVEEGHGIVIAAQ
jgi:hypothetical protein